MYLYLYLLYFLISRAPARACVRPRVLACARACLRADACDALDESIKEKEIFSFLDRCYSRQVDNILI